MESVRVRHSAFRARPAPLARPRPTCARRALLARCGRPDLRTVGLRQRRADLVLVSGSSCRRVLPSHSEVGASPLPDPSVHPRGKGVNWVFHPPRPAAIRYAAIWLRDECLFCWRDPGAGRVAGVLLSYSWLWNGPSGAAAAKAEGWSQIQTRAARGQFT